MNIDINKLKLRLTGQYVGIVLSCKIEKVNCTDCKWNGRKGYIPTELPTCKQCIYNPKLLNAFELKKNELDNLFIGAPVMVSKSIPINYIPSEFHKKFNDEREYKFQADTGMYAYCRLPTIEESPRNVWLAPHLEMLTELQNFRVILWGKNGDITVYNKGDCDFNNIAWSNVVKFQILEDFKK